MKKGDDLPVWAKAARAEVRRTHASLFRALMVPDEEFAKQNLEAEIRDAIGLLHEHGYIVSMPVSEP